VNVFSYCDYGQGVDVRSMPRVGVGVEAPPLGISVGEIGVFVGQGFIIPWLGKIVAICVFRGVGVGVGRGASVILGSLMIFDIGGSLDGMGEMQGSVVGNGLGVRVGYMRSDLSPSSAELK
jgi:hypothetical protein